jgi:hypothetical protein
MVLIAAFTSVKVFWQEPMVADAPPTPSNPNPKVHYELKITLPVSPAGRSCTLAGSAQMWLDFSALVQEKQQEPDECGLDGM